MSKCLQKAYELSNVKISFVSLVDAAANKRKFLITKAEDGQAQFSTYGRILKAEDEGDAHYVTGVVYEPLEEDAHGNFMTEDEIIKTAHWFMKNGNRVDLQHSFVPMDGATVVESWVAKSDFDIDGETVKKGTWMMTVEVTDPDVWNAIQKGAITGFSMGGVGEYSEEDVKLDEIEKTADSGEKKGILKSIAEALGFSVVTKGQVAELYEERSKASRFWNAFDSLECSLRQYDWVTDKYTYASNENEIREALEEFGTIITDILAEKSVAKAIDPGDEQVVTKAGRKMSASNLETLTGIKDSLESFLKTFEPDECPDEKDKDTQEDDVSKSSTDTVTKEKEDVEMTRQEVESVVKAAVEEALAKKADEKKPEDEEEKQQSETNTETDDKKTEEDPEKKEDDEKVTKESVEKMVADAVAKALEPITKAEEPNPVEKAEELTLDAIQKMVSETVEKAVEPVLKARGVPMHMAGDPVEKSEQHYLHGIL